MNSIDQAGLQFRDHLPLLGLKACATTAWFLSFDKERKKTPEEYVHMPRLLTAIYCLCFGSTEGSHTSPDPTSPPFWGGGDKNLIM